MPSNGKHKGTNSDSEDSSSMKVFTISSSRRAFLTSASTGAVALAGCLGNTSGGGSNGSDGGGGSNSSSESGGSKGSGEAIKIGFALPETGSYATLSQYMVDGFKLKVDHQLDGKINGHDIEYIRRDTETDPSTGVSVTRELVEKENVDIIAGPISSAVMNAMIPEIEGNDVVWFNLHAGDPLIVKEGCLKNQFNPSFNLWQTSYPMGKWVKKNVADSAHIVYADYAGGRGASTYFPRAFKEQGGTIAGKTAIELGTSDFAPFLQEVQDSDAEIVYSFFAGGDAVNFIKGYQNFGIEKPLLGEGWLVSPNLLEPLGQAAKGIRTSLHYTPALDNEANKKFTSDFNKQYDTGPNVMSVAAYDGAQILKLVVDETGGFGVEEFNQVVPKLEIDSPRGPLSFQKETHEPIQNIYVREVSQSGNKLINKQINTIKSVNSPTWGCDLS